MNIHMNINSYPYQYPYVYPYPLSSTAAPGFCLSFRQLRPARSEGRLDHVATPRVVQQHFEHLRGLHGSLAKATAWVAGESNGWLVVEAPPEKYMSSSVGMMKFPNIYGKIWKNEEKNRNMFQTTNQMAFFSEETLWFCFVFCRISLKPIDNDNDVLLTLSICNDMPYPIWVCQTKRNGNG